MNVGQLISQLKKFPKNMEVRQCEDYCTTGTASVEKRWLPECGGDCDYADGKLTKKQVAKKLGLSEKEVEEQYKLYVVIRD